jgi:hypothetical protein
MYFALRYKRGAYPFQGLHIIMDHLVDDIDINPRDIQQVRDVLSISVEDCTHQASEAILQSIHS